MLIYSKDKVVQLHFQEEQSVGGRAAGSCINPCDSDTQTIGGGYPK